MNAHINCMLPASGIGYVCYNREAGGADHIGLISTIKAIQNFALEWYGMHPDALIQIGDISRVHGVAFPPHVGHLRGLEFDVRPFRLDRQLAPVSVTQTKYDAILTREFVRNISTQFQFELILFNDKKLIQEKATKRSAGHDNHIHFRLSGGQVALPYP